MYIEKPGIIKRIPKMPKLGKHLIYYIQMRLLNYKQLCKCISSSC